MPLMTIEGFRATGTKQVDELYMFRNAETGEM